MYRQSIVSTSDLIWSDLFYYRHHLFLYFSNTTATITWVRATDTEKEKKMATVCQQHNSFSNYLILLTARKGEVITKFMVIADQLFHVHKKITLDNHFV